MHGSAEEERPDAIAAGSDDVAPMNRYVLLGVLLLVLASNYVDRFALALLLQDIKIDLALNDTQLGLLSGIAFALFYSVMGIPIARWADRGNRVSIIAITTAIWSAAVALCGAAGSFVQLLLIRVGVAVGEAGCIPPAHSLIADYFSRSERPRAMAIYMIGGPLGVTIGNFMAGWLNELYGWRLTFVILGLPGLALAALAWRVLREPRARIGSKAPGTLMLAQRHRGTAQPAQPELRQVCRALWASRTFRHLLIAFSLILFFGNGIWQWAAVFFIRSFGVRTGELGTWFAVIWGVGGLLGTYWGGVLATRYAANNEALQLKVMAIAYCCIGMISSGLYLSSSQQFAFALMAVAAISMSTVSGPFFATIQTLVPPSMRATSIALIYLFANLIGMGLGPLAAGFLSDALRPWAGEESLRYALLALCPGYFWCAWHLWRGSMSADDDLAVHAGSDERTRVGIRHRDSKGQRSELS